ncbi:MAG: M48 family metalloprotease [Elusimicrobia bacterium]|nr:M48 family metalloprotease [Elusimicrobiota bacterium]
MRRAAAVLLAAALAGCASMDAAMRTATGYAQSQGLISESQAESLNKSETALRRGSQDISESEEYYIGRAVAAQILARYRPLDDRDLNDYLQEVLQTVAGASDRPAIYGGWHVQVLDTEEVNAMSAPGGFVFVTKGLLERVRSEDELACVLAHEVAHVSKKHGLKTIKAARLTQAFAILGREAAKSYAPEQVSRLTEAFGGAVDDVVDDLVVKGYSRSKEYEADRFAAEYARAAGYDPNALKSFLKRLESEPARGGLFKTHPSPAARLAELGRLEPPPGDVGSAARARRFAAAMRSL